ncbi:hypothetical protein EV715DRAFT_213975 [Schizophyllum commune]
MGQYHEGFIIAKVKPHGGGQAQYRSLGGVWNSWCYGSLPVKAAHRMITLLKQPLNAHIVREELRSIEGKYGAYGEEEPKIGRLPCPYAHFLLQMAFNVDYDKDSVSLSGRWFGVGSYKHICGAEMGCWEEENTDGLTIIDITDPEHPRYCFLPGHETPIKSPRMTPLSVKQYLGAYYKKEDKAGKQWKHCEEVFALFKDIPLLSARDIAKAWPDESRYNWNDFDDDEEEEEAEAGDGGDEAARANGDETSDRADDAPEIPSLASLTLGPSIKQALETGDADGISPFLMQPGTFAKVMEVTRAFEEPIPDVSIPVLAKAVEFAAEENIDFSDVQLTGEQLVRVLPAGKPIDSLDLSGNTALDGDGLRALLEAKLPIRRLILLRTGVTDNDLRDILHTPTIFYRTEEVIHPLLLGWYTASTFPCAFTLRINSGTCDSYEASGIASVPLLSVRQLAQNLALFVDAMLEGSFASGFGRGDSHFEAVVTAGVIPEGKSWGERPVWCTPASRGRTVPREGGWMLYVEPPTFPRDRMRYAVVHCKPDEEGKKVVNKVYTPEAFIEKLKEDGYHTTPEDIAALEGVFLRLDRGA